MTMPQDHEEMSGRFYDLLGTTLHKEKFVEDNAVVLPSQRAIEYGSPWLRFTHAIRGCRDQHPAPHWHWGRVLTLREYALGRLEAGDTPEEIEDNVERLHMRYLRGWRLSSVHCDVPRAGAEWLESVIIASVWPITPMEYFMAEGLGFRGRRIKEELWFRHLQRRYRSETRREAQQAGLRPGDPLFVPVQEGE